MWRSAAFCVLGMLPCVCAANDFPTLARVEFVLGCMNERGGQSYDTLYPCVCLIDRVAETMSYDEFSEGMVFRQLRSTPGERGGVFRDPEQAETLTDKLDTAIEQAEQQCVVARITPNDEAAGGGEAGDAAPDAPAAPQAAPAAPPPQPEPVAPPRQPEPVAPRAQ